MTAEVTKHLPLLAGAPDGIQRLRALILDLAVSGKLVPHDERPTVTEDRPLQKKASASIKPMSVLDEGRTPFPIPSNWAWAKLGDIAVIERGGSPRPIKSFLTNESHGLSWIKIGDTEKGGKYITSASEKIRPEGLSKTRMVYPGDFLLTNSMSFGRPYITQIEGCIHDGWLRISPPDCLDRDYLYSLLSSPYVRRFFVNAAAGAVVMNLNADKVRELPVPVPPLAAQHRIVARVDELMALCDRLEADQTDAEAAHAQLVQALLDSLTRATDAADFRASWQRLSEHFHTLFTTEDSVDALKQTVLQLAVMGKLVPQDSAEESVNAFLQRLHDARGKQDADKTTRSRVHLSKSSVMAEPLYEAPHGWAWRSLGSLLSITGGVTLGRKLAGRKLLSKPYLRVANVQRSYLVLDQIKNVEVPEDEVEKYRLLPNDLLITEGGDWDKVGRTAIWRGEIADCLHQNHVFKARAPSAEFSHRWAELYLNAQPARHYFAGSSKQTTNLASINMTQLRACAFPVPPISEQHRIIAKVDELMALCDQLKVQLAQARQQHAQLAAVLVEQAVA